MARVSLSRDISHSTSVAPGWDGGLWPFGWAQSAPRGLPVVTFEERSKGAKHAPKNRQQRQKIVWGQRRFCRFSVDFWAPLEAQRTHGLPRVLGGNRNGQNALLKIDTKSTETRLGPHHHFCRFSVDFGWLFGAPFEPARAARGPGGAEHGQTRTQKSTKNQQKLKCRSGPKRVSVDVLSILGRAFLALVTVWIRNRTRAVGCHPGTRPPVARPAGKRAPSSKMYNKKGRSCCRFSCPLRGPFARRWTRTFATRTTPRFCVARFVAGSELRARKGSPPPLHLARSRQQIAQQEGVGSCTFSRPPRTWVVELKFARASGFLCLANTSTTCACVTVSVRPGFADPRPPT